MPSTRGLGKQLERIVFNNSFSGKVKSTNEEKQDESEANPLRFLKGNPLLERIKYFAQSQRNWPERIFWFVAFVFSLTAAVALIYRVWNDESKAPVTVAFRSQKLNIDSIPFPAVTICNMNQFPKSKVEKILKRMESDNDDIRQQGWTEFRFVRAICNSHKSFAKHFRFADFRAYHTEVEMLFEDDLLTTGERQDEMTDFLLKNTQSCKQLIRLCKLGEETVDCSKIFKPVITDHGKCCTFNMLPLPLLLRHPDTANATHYDNPGLGTNARKYWPRDEIKNWTKWNYNKGFILEPGSGQKYPWTQKRAGLPFGLSILVDAHPEEYYCPTSDSIGVRYILHSVLERPHVMALASVAGLQKEVLVEVHPDMTTADKDIQEISIEKRDCVFASERYLHFFGPYTDGNCNEECVNLEISKRCDCTFFFMRRIQGKKICNYENANCITRERISLLSDATKICSHCIPLCEDIAYNYETTAAELQNMTDLWLDPAPVGPSDKTPPPPDWANHQVSIIHFFYGSESTVPKFRKRRYAITDLVANTGGVLGLCIGFSVLSAVEIVYFVVIRLFVKLFKKRGLLRLWKKVCEVLGGNKSSSNRVIQVNPSFIPFYGDSDPFFYKRQRQF